jgi:hypothetical protein
MQNRKGGCFMNSPARPKGLYPQACDVAAAAQRHIDSPQTRSATYRLAYQDNEFMLRDELRPVRLQLELFRYVETAEEAWEIIREADSILNPREQE